MYFLTSESNIHIPMLFITRYFSLFSFDNDYLKSILCCFLNYFNEWAITKMRKYLIQLHYVRMQWGA